MQRHPIAGLILPFVVAFGCQFFAVHPASAQAPGIFIPKPRGDTSIDPTDNSAAQSGATVLGLGGERLTGTVSSISNGTVQFSGSLFAQTVDIFTAALQEIRFPSRGSIEGGHDLVILTNGDRICGKVQGMTATDTAFESDTVGFLKIGNSCIRQIGFQGGVGALARTDFAGGQPAPLQIAGGGWQISNGLLRIGPPAAATLSLDQSSAITAVLQFSNMGSAWNLSLFSDQPGQADNSMNPQMGQMAPMGRGRRVAAPIEGSALTLALSDRGSASSASYSITAWSGPGQHSAVINGLPARPNEAQEVRLAYDPANGEVKLWVNGQIVNQAKAPDAPKQGKYIVFTAQDVSTLKSFEVFQGVATPAKVSDDADPNDITVTYQSGEHMHAQALAFSEGVFALKTAFSDTPISIAAGKVASITMSKSGRETQPPPEHPVQIVLSKSLLTVDLIELNGKQAIAKSPYLGEIKIVRDAIHSLRFLTPAASQ